MITLHFLKQFISDLNYLQLFLFNMLIFFIWVNSGKKLVFFKGFKEKMSFLHVNSGLTHVNFISKIIEKRFY